MREGIGTITNDDVATGGLVAAFGFEEGAGTAVADSSGTGNNGAISRGMDDGRRVRQRAVVRRRQRLGHDCRRQLVGPDEPDDAGGVGSPGFSGELGQHPHEGERGTTGLGYSLYVADGAESPAFRLHLPQPRRLHRRDRDARGEHVGGSLRRRTTAPTLRLYVNGTQAASTAITGNMPNTANPLRLGGNAVWGEWFSGLIDEVRVYNRAPLRPRCRPTWAWRWCCRRVLHSLCNPSPPHPCRPSARVESRLARRCCGQDHERRARQCHQNARRSAENPVPASGVFWRCPGTEPGRPWVCRSASGPLSPVSRGEG